MRNECCNVVTEAVKSADIKITLEQWPCAVAIASVCITCAFVAWLKQH